MNCGQNVLCPRLPGSWEPEKRERGRSPWRYLCDPPATLPHGPVASVASVASLAAASPRQLGWGQQRWASMEGTLAVPRSSSQSCNSAIYLASSEHVPKSRRPLGL